MPLQPAVVDVLPTQPGVRYSRDVFGHFIEHFHRQVYDGLYDPGSPLSDQRGFRLDVIEAVRELAPSVVRWPGGCFVSSYHWLDGVGEKRRPHYDKAWRVTDPNTFGTREFIEWCEAIGAAPYICTNAGSGGAEEMSDWVEYCNLAAGAGHWADLRGSHGSSEPFGVRYWSIGNENYGDWEMGAKTPQEWSSLVRESAKMMRRVDESITLLTAARADLEWTLPLLEAAGPYLDMVSIHGYWDRLSQVNEPGDYLTTMARALGPQDDINRTADILGAAGLADRVGIAFDEWNLRGWHHPDGTSQQAIQARDLNDDNSAYTMADAVFSAGFLNACLRRADVVKMANIAPMINTRGPLFVHPDGVVKRSTFHLLAMYANQLGSQVLASTARCEDLQPAGVPVIDQIATIDDGGTRISISLVNRDPGQVIDTEVRVAGHRLDGRYEATLLTGPNVHAYNDLDRPNVIQPTASKVEFTDGCMALPPHSVTIVQIDLPLNYPAGQLNLPPALDASAWQLGPTGWHRSSL